MKARALGVGVGTVLLVSMTTSAAAGSWDLDPGFSGDGKLRVPHVLGGSGNAEAIHVVNGQVYASGTKYSGAGSGVFVIRTLSDGTLDSSFGVNGVATTAARRAICP